MGFGAVPLPDQSRHLVELSHGIEAAALFAVADYLETVSLELGNGIELFGGGGVDVDGAIA